MTEDTAKKNITADEPRTEHEREAEARWGQSDAYRASQKRTQKYTEQDWVEIKAEALDIVKRMAAARKDGAVAESNAAMDLAEEYRLHIDRRFYACSHDMHASLADMYVSDDRFREYYDNIQDGLAEYVADAIIANGVRAVGDDVGVTSALEGIRAAQGLNRRPDAEPDETGLDAGVAQTVEIDAAKQRNR